MTRAEKRVVRKAAQAVVRYRDWHNAKTLGSARPRPHDKRRLDVYTRDNLRPVRPKEPDAEQWAAWKELRKPWAAGYAEARRDTRPKGSSCRRKPHFPGRTGDEIIEAFTKGDGTRWAYLASRALDLSLNKDILA